MNERSEVDLLRLPSLGAEDDDGEGPLQDAPAELRLIDDGQADAFDDELASDVPLDIELSSTAHEPSAIGDDATGIEDEAQHQVALSSQGGSLLDDGEHLLGFDGDEQLGLDPIPIEADDGGREGLDDADAERIEAELFPPLDGDDSEDEQPIELGLTLEPLEPLPRKR